MPRLRAAVAVGLGALLLAGFAPAAVFAASPDFPAKDSRYHNYPEMVAEIMAAEAAYPELVDVFSIGQSQQGREIWAAKVSDNVAVDENEPEILFDSLHHAREHMGVEQNLYLLQVLATDYTTDPQVRALVDEREIFIVFAVNPDGFEFDLSATTGSHAPYRAWRKSRQPNAGSTAVGTDLNRNYGYRFGCCGGSSGTKSSITYRGPAAWSAPETRAMRDFVASRVVNGRQQIKTHVTLHTNGELVLWPYGYTKTNLPWDMTKDDLAAFVAFGKGMAGRNGYKAQQSSDLYITDGDQIDWMYGAYRIFSFTWELYPPETATVWGDHYPADENIARETARNRSALLFTIDVGACPYRWTGKAKTHCGPLFDDLEAGRGWEVNPDGTDTATAGAWQRGNPDAISRTYKLTQLGTTTSGVYGLVTGAKVNGGASQGDVDGGTTTVRSAPVELGAAVGDLTFRYYLAHQLGSSAADAFRAYVEDGTGTRTLVLEELGGPEVDVAAWATARVPMSPWAGQTVRIVFQATDAENDSLVEAGADDVRIEQP
ncbi:MAG: M14 family metallopeptidase [Chloroflexota bacterium]|nr:M14 family metallopeptidase [Chloroflexota bacterium]